jgi:hypothetical protein
MQLNRPKGVKMLNHKMPFLFLVLTISIFSIQNSRASSISYQLQNLGIDHYRYTYTIINNGSLPNNGSIQLVDILFDTTLYNESSLSISSASSVSSSWSEQILASAPGIPATYDFSSKGLGLQIGSSFSGFSIDFEWLGSGLPGAQGFEIYDPSNFNLLETGTTKVNTQVVPIPGAFVYFLSSLFGVKLFGRRLFNQS